MPQFFFNLADGRTIRDTDGEECADLDAAMAVAIQTARELAANKKQSDISDFYVTVTDKDDTEVFRTPLSQALLPSAVHKGRPEWGTMAWPKCEKCGRIMRLVGLEPRSTHPHCSLHTYECQCGETAVFEVASM